MGRALAEAGQGGARGVCLKYQTYAKAVNHRTLLEGPALCAFFIEREKLLQRHLKAMLFAVR